MRRLYLFFCLFFSGCTQLPEGIEPVSNFDINRYLGEWYEIARLDHSFERGLSRVTANYSRNKDGSVKVVNKGFSQDKNEWKSAEGKAKFVDKEDVGHLKVSFFGPFYGAYVIFSLDKNYNYALVCGPDRDYLWLLAREPDLDDAIYERLMKMAEELGFATGEILRIRHDNAE